MIRSAIIKAAFPDGLEVEVNQNQGDRLEAVLVIFGA